MKKLVLIAFILVAFSFASKAQTVYISWVDNNYSGYYTVKLYVQTNDNPPSTPILVGEKKNVPVIATSFISSEMNLPTVINDMYAYYRYIALVFRQADPTHNGTGNSPWLDSDEFLSGAEIPGIQIN